MSEKELLNKLKYLIGKHKEVDEICKILDLSYEEVLRLAYALKEINSCYDIVEGVPVKKRNGSTFREKYIIKSDKDKQICLVSDVHYGDINDGSDRMRKVYQMCKERDIDTILCAGDYTDGYAEKDHKFQRKIYGVDNTIEYIVNEHPYDKDIKFYTIGGNHDASFFVQTGREIIAEISEKRDDIIYLGQDEAAVMFNNINISIIHGCRKSKHEYLTRTKASFYDLARAFYENLEEKPDIMQLGHIHSNFYKKLNDTHIFQTAALVDFHNKAFFDTDVSCWFAHLSYDEEGKLCKVIPELEDLGYQRVRK